MYITVERLKTVFSQQILIQLSNDDARATTVNTDVVQQAISVAKQRIDASLRGRYRLPLAEIPEMVEHHTLYLARYWLYARRPEMPVPETVKTTYDQAIKELEQIANGRLHLGLPSLDDEQFGDLMSDSGEFRVRAKQGIDLSGY